MNGGHFSRNTDSIWIERLIADWDGSSAQSDAGNISASRGKPIAASAPAGSAAGEAPAARTR
jgi:hypothetical protein